MPEQPALAWEPPCSYWRGLDAATAQSKHVLVLHSFGQHFKPWKEYAETIRAELNQQSPWVLDITDQSLVAARSGDQNPEVPFVEYLRALFGKHAPDLIVSIGAPAAAFVQRHRKDLFATIPMAFTAVEGRRVDYAALTENDVVVAVSINYFAAFQNILQVLPDTKNGAALSRLHAVANAPIFSYDDSFFGRAIVGGPIHSVLESSRQTAAVAVRLLGGEKAGDIKIPPVEFARPKFDWRELRRWGVSESRLPPGSEIHFRSPSLWNQYRTQILGVVAIGLGQSVLIVWLLYEHRQRRRSEAAANELSGRLISAQEEERARLARELHDDVTQRLGVLALEAGREERNLPNSVGGAAMRSMREGLARLSGDVHALSYRLHPYHSRRSRLTRGAEVRVRTFFRDSLVPH